MLAEFLSHNCQRGVPPSFLNRCPKFFNIFLLQILTGVVAITNPGSTVLAEDAIKAALNDYKVKQSSMSDAKAE